MAVHDSSSFHVLPHAHNWTLSTISCISTTSFSMARHGPHCMRLVLSDLLIHLVSSSLLASSSSCLTVSNYLNFSCHSPNLLWEICLPGSILGVVLNCLCLIHRVLSLIPEIRNVACIPCTILKKCLCRPLHCTITYPRHTTLVLYRCFRRHISGTKRNIISVWTYTLATALIYVGNFLFLLIVKDLL